MVTVGGLKEAHSYYSPETSIGWKHLVAHLFPQAFLTLNGIDRVDDIPLFERSIVFSHIFDDEVDGNKCRSLDPKVAEYLDLNYQELPQNREEAKKLVHNTFDWFINALEPYWQELHLNKPLSLYIGEFDAVARLRGEVNHFAFRHSCVKGILAGFIQHCNDKDLRSKLEQQYRNFLLVGDVYATDGPVPNQKANIYNTVPLVSLIATSTGMQNMFVSLFTEKFTHEDFMFVDNLDVMVGFLAYLMNAKEEEEERESDGFPIGFDDFENWFNGLVDIFHSNLDSISKYKKKNMWGGRYFKRVAQLAQAKFVVEYLMPFHPMHFSKVKKDSRYLNISRLYDRVLSILSPLRS